MLTRNVFVKKYHKNVWTFKGCRVWITANNLKSKMGECLAGTAWYWSWIVYHHIIMHIFNLAKQVAYFKALGRDTYLSREKELVATKGEKCLFKIQNRRWNLSINVRDWDLLLVSLYLRFAFRVCNFLRFVILAGPQFEMSHFLIIMNLFCFMSVLAHSKFPQN